MAIFLTSDQHYNHIKIIEFEKRPYANVEQMNTDLIARHNAMVSNEDTVYILGDFIFGTKPQFCEILNALNGHLILIPGNHDRLKPSFMRRVGLEVANRRQIVEGVILSHHPLENVDDFNFHGHVHSRWKVNGKKFNVGVDVNGYRPVPWSLALSELQIHQG